jgi:hypothetical protein
MTRAVNWPTPGRAVSALTRGFCLGIVTQLVIEPVNHGRQNVDERRAVGDDLPGHRRQVQFSQPAAAVPGPAAAGLVVAELVAAARTSREVAGAPGHQREDRGFQPVQDLPQARGPLRNGAGQKAAGKERSCPSLLNERGAGRHKYRNPPDSFVPRRPYREAAMDPAGERGVLVISLPG